MISGRGIVTIDLGAYPGAGEGTHAVVGEGNIPANAIAQAWIFPRLTTDHSADEHALEPLLVTCGAVTAGVGFTITVAPTMNRQFGKWSVAWAWEPATV